MRPYIYKEEWKKLITPEIVALLTKIHEHKGQQNLFIVQKPEILSTLLEVAKIQSTESSNKIEGIYTSIERLKLITLEKTMPQSRDEQEIAGYRDVLNTIHESYDYIAIKPNFMLQLHKNLYKYSGFSFGGKYKNSDNIITEELYDGTTRVRFQPVKAWETQGAVEELCKEYNQIMATQEVDPLLIIPMFILDFLCIHPFNDGNGRMSRLLTLLLLYQSSYIVGKYISIERIIEHTKETYYEVLQKSSDNWHQNANDYAPFVKYMLGVILAAYREFEEKVDILYTKKYSKPQVIENVIRQTLGKITKREILEKCPETSSTTIQRTLNELVKSKKIIKIGGGRYTSYVYNHE